MSNCRQEREIGEHNKAIQTLEGQTDELFIQDRKRREEIVENEKKVLIMQGSIDEVRQEVHSVREDLDRVISDISDMKKTAQAKAEKDHIFQIEMKEEMGRFFEKLEENAPPPPEPFATVKVSRFFAANPKTLILICLIFCFTLLAAMLIWTGQTEYLPELWQGLNPFKAAGAK